MGVLLQAAYRQGHGNSVPSPADGNHITPWWWDHLADQAHALRLSGFTAVLLPPVLKTSAGSFPGADGYGPFDDYNLGSKDQFFAVPTRFGNREQLQRCVAVMRANGLDVYVDVVPHQRNGGNNFEYRYQAAGGAAPGVSRSTSNASFRMFLGIRSLDRSPTTSGSATSSRRSTPSLPAMSCTASLTPVTG